MIIFPFATPPFNLNQFIFKYNNGYGDKHQKSVIRLAGILMLKRYFNFKTIEIQIMTGYQASLSLAQVEALPW